MREAQPKSYSPMLGQRGVGGRCINGRGAVLCYYKSMNRKNNFENIILGEKNYIVLHSQTSLQK